MNYVPETRRHQAALAARPLRGVTWRHPRGVDSILAVSEVFAAEDGGTPIEWDARPLHEFEDVPVSVLASRYDLLAIDHPFIGDSVASGSLYPLDHALSTSELLERSDDAVGRSHLSYAWEGHQWALPIDAACMVSAFRADLLGSGPPRSWAAVDELARSLPPGKVVLAANPTHLWGTVLTVCQALLPDENQLPDGRPTWWPDSGIDGELLAAAIDLVRGVLDRASPESLTLDPIAVLERLSSTDDFVYCPLVFGYVTYSRRSVSRHVLTFADAPGDASHPVGTLTGGVGLAVSAWSDRPRLAADFVRLASQREVQKGIYQRAGGQPGRRSAWTDAAVNADAHAFFANTIQTMDRSFLRPRLVGYPSYQRSAAAVLHSHISSGTPARRTASELGKLWHRDARA